MQAAVAAGEYDSPSAILHEALADWQRKRALELPDAVWLRAAWEEGLASGEPVPFDPEAIRARLSALLPVADEAAKRCLLRNIIPGPV